MKRASYRDAIDYIAMNDDPGDPEALNEEVVAGYVTVQLVCCIFGVESERVARDVVRYRKREAA